MFIEPYIDIGTAHKGETKTISFSYDDDDIVAISVIQGCGCSSVKLNKDNHTVEMVFTPAGIPKHLEHQGSYTTTKVYDIAVTYKDGKILGYNLAFKVKIIR